MFNNNLDILFSTVLNKSDAIGSLDGIGLIYEMNANSPTVFVASNGHPKT